MILRTDFFSIKVYLQSNTLKCLYNNNKNTKRNLLFQTKQSASFGKTDF